MFGWCRLEKRVDRLETAVSLLETQVIILQLEIIKLQKLFTRTYPAPRTISVQPAAT